MKLKNRGRARDFARACSRAKGFTLVEVMIGMGVLAVMGVSLHHIVIDTHDLPALARFWAQVLGWRILSEREREVVIGPEETAPVGICFMPSPDDKTVKNRVHLDLNPGANASGTERDAEIESR